MAGLERPRTHRAGTDFAEKQQKKTMATNTNQSTPQVSNTKPNHVGSNRVGGLVWGELRWAKVNLTFRQHGFGRRFFVSRLTCVFERTVVLTNRRSTFQIAGGAWTKIKVKEARTRGQTFLQLHKSSKRISTFGKCNPSFASEKSIRI